nr:isoleucine--tRNA ligase [Candidatus Dadabacteria bacterium]NIQ15531.1 isoleucine--tRNA ligase [Candidatus Dadabacteria bacterium]
MSNNDKINYKNTLNLPKTDFPMKANLQQKEPEIQKVWEKENLYENVTKNNQNDKSFIFHDGPPYANGPIHLGHLLNKVLKDIVVRSKIMEGHNVEYIPGWDCHGLPIEHKVLKELGDEAKDLTKLKIRNKCKSYAEKYVKLQSKQMIRLGTHADYKNPYLTMTPDYEASVLEVFSELVKKGLVYRDLKPVHWSIENQTALADAELEYYDKEDKSIYVLLEINNIENLPDSLNHDPTKKIHLMIWTTTPWTLPANLAVAVAPEGKYVLYNFNSTNVIIVENLAEKIFDKADITDYQKLGVCLGSELYENNIEYNHPFINRKGKVLTADYVTFEDGTGLVHTAPGHGVEDYQTGLKEGLDIYCPVKADGKFDNSVPSWIQDVDVWQGNELIIDKLESDNNLFYVEKYIHSYPHDWRSKTPTIFRATDQWFISVDKSFTEDNKTLRELSLDSVENNIEFYPDWGKNRLKGMLEARPDWCISRQRSWGLPIPSFIDEEGRSFLTPKSLEAVIDKIRGKGSNIWFIASAEELLSEYDPIDDNDAPDWIRNKDDLKKLSKGKDIFDVWFESGSSWNAVLKNRNIGYPADLYLEGSDQHRGWFQLSLLPALGVSGIPPFKALLTHGFMVDSQGRKMSKSGGNALEVDEILKRYGADVCRWWVSTLKYSNDVKVDWDYFKVAADDYRKIRNTIRFLLGNINDFNYKKDRVDLNDDDKFSIDYWAYCELIKFNNECFNAYKAFQYKTASDLIFNFCNNTLSAIYLACVKDRLYCDRIDSRKRRRTQTVMYKISDSLIKFLAPILVHTTYEAYNSLLGEKGLANIHFEKFPITEEIDVDPIWDEIMELRSKGLKALEDAKEKKGINNPLDAELYIQVDKKLYNKISKY